MGTVYGIDPTYYIGKDPHSEEVQKKTKEILYEKIEEVERYRILQVFQDSMKYKNEKFASEDDEQDGDDEETPPLVDYLQPAYAVDKLIAGNTDTTSGCQSRVPCYKQHINDYESLWRVVVDNNNNTVSIESNIDYNCLSGCVPVATAIIF